MNPMEIAVLVILTLINGFFALSEIAIVSVRKSRLEEQAKAGIKNAQLVLNLRKQPEEFLSAIQVAITLVGIVSGVYGGVALAGHVQPWLAQVHALAPYAEGLSYALVIVVITYFSIVIGELLPKTIAISNPDRIALFVAPAIKIFSKVVKPLVKVLSGSTSILTRMIGIKPAPQEENLSEEELRQILRTAGQQGLLAQDQSEYQQNIFSFGRQKARSMQTHRRDLEWIDINASLERIKTMIHNSVHSKFLVADGNPDNVVGMLTTKDFYEYLLTSKEPLQTNLKKPIYISETMLAGAILSLFRKHKQYIGVVVDEYGAVEGIITLHDILEVIVGDLPDTDESNEPDLFLRADGSYLVNAEVPIRLLNRHFDKILIPRDPENYLTLAGFISFYLSSVPETGERFIYNKFEFEIVDMDGFRIDKVILKEIEN